jgi:hypothetical protein
MISKHYPTGLSDVVEYEEIRKLKVTLIATSFLVA